MAAGVSALGALIGGPGPRVRQRQGRDCLPSGEGGAGGASPRIQVDGGVGVVTARIGAAAGPDVVVCGNAVFGAEDPAAALAAVQAAAGEARLAALAVSKEA